MKTLINVICAFLVIYFFTKEETVKKPNAIDYNKIIYQDNQDILVHKQLCENLKIEIRLLQFDIKNKLGINEND